MSAEYEGQDLNEIAAQAERDLNSTAAKTGSGRGASDSSEYHLLFSSHPQVSPRLIRQTAVDSGVDENVQGKFPGADVTIGSAASGAGDNREIPEEEGGGFNPSTGQ